MTQQYAPYFNPLILLIEQRMLFKSDSPAYQTRQQPKNWRINDNQKICFVKNGCHQLRNHDLQVTYLVKKQNYSNSKQELQAMPTFGSCSCMTPTKKKKHHNKENQSPVASILISPRRDTTTGTSTRLSQKLSSSFSICPPPQCMSHHSSHVFSLLLLFLRLHQIHCQNNHLLNLIQALHFDGIQAL